MPKARNGNVNTEREKRMSLPGKEIELAFEKHLINGLLAMMVDRVVFCYGRNDSAINLNIMITKPNNRLIRAKILDTELCFCFLYSSTYRFNKETIPWVKDVSNDNYYVVCCQYASKMNLGIMGWPSREAYYNNLRAESGTYLDSAIRIVRKKDIPMETISFDPMRLKTVALTDIVVYNTLNN